MQWANEDRHFQSRTDRIMNCMNKNLKNLNTSLVLEQETKTFKNTVLNKVLNKVQFSVAYNLL